MNKLSKIAQQLGKLGGKKSAQSRFSGKSKDEISELMRKVRLSKQDSKDFQKTLSGFVDNLNKNVTLDESC